MVGKLILKQIKNQYLKQLLPIFRIGRFIFLPLSLTFHTIGQDIIRAALTIYVVKSIFFIWLSFTKTKFKVPHTSLIQLTGAFGGIRRVSSEKKRER